MAPGQPARVKVTIPALITSGPLSQVYALYPTDRLQVLPTTTTVTPIVEVTGTTDTAVDWITHGVFPFHDGGGVVGEDGRWTTPSYIGWAFITAVSRADPLQFAVGVVFLVGLDTDNDLEQDAVDMGEASLSWAEPAATWRFAAGRVLPWLIPGGSTFDGAQAIQGGGEAVDDIEVALFQQAIRNAYAVIP